MRITRNPDTIRAAAVERRADRAASVQIQRQQLLLAEERRQAAEQAKTRKRFARQQARTQKQERRADQINRVRAAVPTIGRRVLIVGPILAPMAVAWVGQIQFATGTLSWPLLAALVFAASWELTTAFAGWMFHQARQAGFGGSVYRAATWLFATFAGGMNYWHALDGGPVLNPTPKAVSYGAMSLVGIGLWELYASLVHREALIADGKLPPARPRFGLARWLRYPGRTFNAWSLAIRDGLQTTEEAWSAARGQTTTTAPDQVVPDHIQQTSETTSEPMIRTIDRQVVQPSTEPTPQTMVQDASETTAETTESPRDETTTQPTRRTTSRTSRRTKPKRWTDGELKAELEQIVAAHYRAGGGEIEVAPIAKSLKVGRPRVRKLLDEMNVRPIRKAVNG